MFCHKRKKKKEIIVRYQRKKKFEQVGGRRQGDPLQLIFWGHELDEVTTYALLKHRRSIYLLLPVGCRGCGGRKGKLQNQNNNKISVPCVPCSPSLSKHGLRPWKLIISLCTERNQIGASARQFIHVLNSYNPEGGKQALAKSIK